MAKSDYNEWLNGVHGKFGKLVFKVVQGKSVIARRPTMPDLPPSQAQMDQRERWYQASRYAKAVFGNPAKRPVYEQAAKASGRGLWSTIMTDFLKAPNVDVMDVSKYKGQIGNPITIRASDDVAVVGVNVKITGANAAVIEQGAATLVDGEWVYHATVNTPTTQALTIEATATDQPGNVGEKSVVRPAGP